jgi:hypothetical protein
MQQKMSMTLCGSAFGWEKKLAQRDLPSEDDMFVYMSHRMVRNMTRHGIMQGYACVKSLFRVLVVIRGGEKGVLSRLLLEMKKRHRLQKLCGGTMTIKGSQVAVLT